MSKIITIEQLKSVNRQVDDAVGALVVAAVNSWIETATGRCWGETTAATELHDAAGVVWLNHMDVKAVTSVKTGYPNATSRKTLEPSSYYCTPEGRLVLHRYSQRALPPSTTDYIEVEYTYGVAEAPGDLVLAGLGIATNYYEYVSAGGREVTRAQVGSYTLQYAGAQGTGELSATVSRDREVVNAHALRRV